MLLLSYLTQTPMISHSELIRVSFIHYCSVGGMRNLVLLYSSYSLGWPDFNLIILTPVRKIKKKRILFFFMRKYLKYSHLNETNKINSIKILVSFLFGIYFRWPLWSYVASKLQHWIYQVIFMIFLKLKNVLIFKYNFIITTM